jgi:hypothetical protein
VATAATAPHLIMTYCALLAFTVLRDDYASLDRAALKRMVDARQDVDGGSVFFLIIIYHDVDDWRRRDGRAGAQIRDDARSRRRRFAPDLLRFCCMHVTQRLVLHRPPPRTIAYPTLSGACPLPLTPPSLLIYICMYICI